jgi:hypothetical protein
MGALIRVKFAAAVAPYLLRLTLTDGSVVERDVRDLLVGPIFDPVRTSDSVFRRVRVDGGTVAWPNGADIDPDVLIWGGIAPRRPLAPPPTLRVPRPA